MLVPMPARRDNDRLKPAWDAWPKPHHPVYAMVVWQTSTSGVERAVVKWWER